MLGRYLWLIGHFAFQRSLLLTDRLSFLIGPLVTAMLWLRGETVPDNVTALVATATVSTIGAVLLFRLFAAPFFIWREDQAKIAIYKGELARPERAGRDEFERLVAKKKLQLASEITDFNMACFVGGENDPLDTIRHQSIMRLLGDVNPPRVFWRLMARFLEVGFAIHTRTNDADSKVDRDECVTIGRELIDFLHGRATVAALEEMERELGPRRA
jgi:hypothetical protein